MVHGHASRFASAAVRRFGLVSDYRRGARRMRRRVARRPLARRGWSVESLEPRQLLAGLPLITEFMARNDGFLKDGDGNSPDWIEIQNVGDAPLDLAGYRLTDSPRNPARWVFPSVSVDPGEYLVVFASGQDVADYVDAEGNLHTNFALSAGGEYLALSSPDGTVLSQFGTADVDYPPQQANVSYGTAQQAILVDEQSDAMRLVPLSDAVDAVWTQNGFDALAAGFSSGKASMGYEDEPDARINFNGQFQTTLPSGIHAVYARMEFDLPRASEVSTLTLRMKYDNGFVAYLNGVKVAEAWAPANPQWFTPSTSYARRDAKALQAEQFDLTGDTRHLVDGTNVLAIHGLNHLSDKKDMLLVPELIATVNSPSAKTGYMPAPTPGARNVAAQGVFSGLLGQTRIDGTPGFFDAPFTVEVSTETPGAQIRYTTDGRTPTATTGTVYTGPILIETSTALRAAAFMPGHLPSNVDAQTYLFLDDVIRQPADPPGLPPTWRWSNRDYPADYEMDPRIVDDPAYRDEIVDGLKSIRTVSLVVDTDELIGRSGILNDTDRHGMESERPVSVEIINPDGSLATQVDAGLRIHGNWTRRYNISMKQSFRLSFRARYGAAKLQYPLFPDAPVDEFESVILHAVKLRDDAQLVRDSFGRDTNLAMGNLDAHSTYVHLYLNGLYWGLYNVFERPDSQFAALYLGGRDQDYDALQYEQGVLAIDGDATRYHEMLDLIRTGLTTQESYEAFLRQVDLDSLLDFMLVNQYMAHGEHELRAIGSRVGDPNFRFLVWDLDEQGMLNAGAREDIETYFPTGIYDQLRRHPEIRMRYADRAHKHLTNGGALTPAVAEQRWEDRTQEIHSAVIAETARWGDMRWRDAVPRSPVTRDVEMVRERQRQAEQFFPQRTEALLDELRRSGIYPDIDAPVLNQHGGAVPPEFPLTMTRPGRTGVILYTLDGTDPRMYGGEVSPGAILWEGSPVPITADTVVKARVFAAGEWSALSEAEFFTVGPDSPFHLRITEINYHPHDANLVPGLGEANVDRDQFQFVEITNTGTETVDLSGVELARGVTFTFPVDSRLAAGERAVVVKNQAAFQSRYGADFSVAGEFADGVLPNTQGLLQMRDAAGRLIQSVSYRNQAPWPQRADGKGSSLEIVNPFGAGGDPASWRASIGFGGSPGVAADGNGPSIAINEILAHSLPPDADRLELHNRTSTAVDIGHWYISTSEDDYFMYAVPAGTTVPAGGYQVFTEAEMGLGFSGARGNDVWLIEADATGRPMRFVDHVQFGPSAENVSLGPSPDGDGTWLPLAEPTFGRENSGLRYGEVIISELQFAPLDPDGDQRLLKADDFEFIELYNRTDAAIDLSNWRVTGGVELTLTAGTTIGPRETILVVPLQANDRVNQPIFRVVYAVDPSVLLVGPYSGLLADDGGVIRLERPDQPPATDPTLTPYLVVDQVHYQTAAPWPSEAVGSGASLTRVSPESFGSSAASWTARPASAGTVDFVMRQAGDANGDGQFDPLDIVQVLQAGKYQTGLPASWDEGDWTGDGLFDRLDIVAALQAGYPR